MCHVSLDQVSGGQSAAKTELACEHTSSNNASKATGIFSRTCGMSASNPKKVQASALRLEDGAATNGTNFNRRHGHRNL